MALGHSWSGDSSNTAVTDVIFHRCVSWNMLGKSSGNTMMSCSVISLASTVSMILAARYFPSIRKPPWPLMRSAMTCDLLVSCGVFCLSYTLVLKPPDMIPSLLRVFMQLSFIFFEVMACAYRVLFCGHAVSIMRNPFESHRYPKTVAFWTCSALLVLTGISTAVMWEGATLQEVFIIDLALPPAILLCFGLPALLIARKINKEWGLQCPGLPSVELRQHVIDVETFFLLVTFAQLALNFATAILGVWNCFMAVEIVVAIVALRPAVSSLFWIITLRYSHRSLISRRNARGTDPSRGDPLLRATQPAKTNFREELRLELVYQLAQFISQSNETFIGDTPNTYEAQTFEEIRRHLNMQESYSLAFPHEYACSSSSSSIPQIGQELGFNDWEKIRQALKESVSEGASGRFFYRISSPGVASAHSILEEGSKRGHRQFILKQITEQEKHTLNDVLGAYKSHVQKQHGQSLIQYASCHSVTLHSSPSNPFFFVAMPNFLPAIMWLTFDLKGNTMQRRVLNSNEIHGKTHQPRAKYGTLRDWDWMDAVMRVDADKQDKQRLKQIVEDDADFLASQGLVDYSLLLGIHRLEKKLSAEEREAEISRLLSAGGQGAFVSIDRQKIYFFGIIDVLEKFQGRWKVQHAVLRAACLLACQGYTGADSISAMPPLEYAERFKTFVSEQVLGFDCDSSRPCLTRRGDPARWRRLWLGRCGGLLRKRVDDEEYDRTCRLKELERRLSEVSDLEQVKSQEGISDFLSPCSS